MLLRLLLERPRGAHDGPALSSMLIYLVMAVVLFVRPAGPAAGQGTGMSRRGAHASWMPPVPRSARGRRPAHGAAASSRLLALCRSLALGLAGSYRLPLVTRAMIFAIAALSLDLILGVGGLVSFGHAAFIGIGAYAPGIMITRAPARCRCLAGVLLASALFAPLTGAVSLRTRGVAFIMITLAFGQMAFFLATRCRPMAAMMA